MISTPGVKSKEFGCFWRSMFLVALCYPEKIDNTNKEHLKKRRNYKTYYRSLGNVLPCKFCRTFVQSTLEKKYPLDFSGRYPLIRSIYIWKDAVNEKLIKQGCEFTKPSPPLSVVIAKYSKYLARCNPIEGKCV